MSRKVKTLCNGKEEKQADFKYLNSNNLEYNLMELRKISNMNILLKSRNFKRII